MLNISLNKTIYIQVPENLKSLITDNIFSAIIKDTPSKKPDFAINFFNNCYQLQCENEMIEKTSIPELIYTLEWKIVDQLIEAHREHLQFHGAALEKNGMGYVFIGNPGTGKTSISITLMRQNFNLLSDEVALINPINHLLSPFPRNLIIKPHLQRLINQDKLQLPIDGDDNDKELAFFMPPATFGKIAKSIPIKKIFFLENQQNGETTIRKIGQHEAFNRIIPQLFNPEIIKTSPNSVVALIKKIPCYLLFIDKPLIMKTTEIDDLIKNIIER
jgi:hypothetical protein